MSVLDEASQPASQPASRIHLRLPRLTHARGHCIPHGGRSSSSPACFPPASSSPKKQAPIDCATSAVHGPLPALVLHALVSVRVRVRARVSPLLPVKWTQPAGHSPSGHAACRSWGSS
jgi:hypothetical protein